jgi:hypothetical protein
MFEVIISQPRSSTRAAKQAQYYFTAMKMHLQYILHKLQLKAVVNMPREEID